MPAPTPDYTIQKYTSTLAIPDVVWQTLRGHAKNANVILPHLEYSRTREQSGTPIPSQLWITCTTFRRNAPPTIDFILSCTEGSLASYPIFIVTALRPSQLADDYLSSRLRSMAYSLQSSVPPSRVFSVFAPDTITRRFASIWTDYSGIPQDPAPIYYAAKISHCTRDSYRNREMSSPGVDFSLRPATLVDLPQIAHLCHGFAAESVSDSMPHARGSDTEIICFQEPFTLDQEGAINEGMHLIQKKQVWVHEIHLQNQTSEIACIAAATRCSAGMATISKVYTSTKWRKRGCAERLTRAVVAQYVHLRRNMI